MPVVVPELVYVVGLFFAIVGYMVARGLLATWTHSLGYVLQWLGANLRFKIRLRGLPDPRIDFGRPFRAADHAIVTALQVWADGAEIEMGFFLHGAGRIATLTAQAIDSLAREASETFEWLVHVHLPKRLRHAIEAAFPAALLARLIAHAVARAIPAVRREIHTVTKVLPAQTWTYVMRAAPIALPIPLGLPHLWREIHGLTKRNLRLSKRLHRVEGLFGVAAMAAVMANVLGLPNWRCLTRGNIGRAARHFCGLDKWLVDLLLLGAVEAFIAADLCAFTHLLQVEAKKAKPLLLELVKVEDALINCNGTTKPIDFALPPLSLPPMPGPSALAA